MGEIPGREGGRKARGKKEPREEENKDRRKEYCL